MRDLSQWKDKVELRLDGRQLFFVFFGGATLACLLFTLGVMTGRRLEARAIALETPATDDPLAMLDQLGDLEDEELSYHQALTKGTRGKEEAAAPKPVAQPAKPAAATAPAKPAAPAIAPKPAAPALKPAAPVKPAAAHAENDAVESPAPAAAAPVAPAKETVVAAKEPTPSVNSSHFTLQLSAFAAKKDADDFLRRVQAAGYRAFVVSSDVPGRGLMHRVRVGDYASKEVALAEKTSVEKKLKVVAYLAKL